MRFSNIPAHDNVKERLRALADSDRIPHAMLLEGGSGIGKLALARAFAQYIHCTDRQDGDSCGRCPSCIQHQALSHIDTHYVFPVVKPEKSTTPPISDDFLEEWKAYLDGRLFMDFEQWAETFTKKNAQPITYVTESNDLIHRLSYASHASQYKIVIWWLPEKMNVEAANKLLKIIEEPYKDTIFIMASDKPEALLPTIYSRVQRIKLRRLPDETIAKLLVDRGIDPTDAEAIAHTAEGNMVKALRTVDTRGEDKARFDMFTSLMRLAYQRDIFKLREWGNELAALGREKEIKFYEYAARLIRENFIYNFRLPQIVYLNSAESQFSSRFARFITERNAEKLVETFENAIRDIAGNGNGKIINLDVAIKVILLLKQ